MPRLGIDYETVKTDRGQIIKPRYSPFCTKDTRQAPRKKRSTLSGKTKHRISRGAPKHILSN
ncbi:MAG: hypothetical protein A3F11_02170 [Gammaproteobacteria bacterium RIFCSPHIGHO2_12_FULL_37_14]|nr:MAG: hypothetical protein A3F11_02170 [Gammaproteobacteria bacterium RIFCSPHIGHO2_12_FULL_37_14]